MDALNNPNHTPPKIGDRVSVHVPREAILVLED
jgi:hypothetical protein